MLLFKAALHLSPKQRYGAVWRCSQPSWAIALSCFQRRRQKTCIFDLWVLVFDITEPVEVYSRKHASSGEENVLNCFVSGFHPPKIDITLLKNGEPMTGVQYADMSFNDKWLFQRLVYAPFTPQKGDIYVCRVAHSAFREPQSFRWGIVCLPLQALLGGSCAEARPR
uniref:Beta-2-microglobulin n=1 Tax=Strix occidentalis caurina TaxID=311401 RepID=A0A8D0EKG4_STROC